jgi:hypothetical protein
MSSVILTKVNTVTPRNFGQQIEFCSGQSDTDFLLQFVKACHKNPITEVKGNTIKVVTKRKYYQYTAYSKYIVRLDLETQNKKYYKIS